MTMYYRQQKSELIRRINGDRRFIQILSGPRQTGKTTLAHQAAEEIGVAFHYASADSSGVPDTAWIQSAWESARVLQNNNVNQRVLLILDEIQKIDQWSTAIKAEWDRDTQFNRNIHVVILGSAPLSIQQ